MSASDRSFSWVQGMRDPDRVDSRMTWTELLWRRLTGRFAGIISGDNTIAAERALGVRRSMYYNIDYCFPKFGHQIVAHSGYPVEDHGSSEASPFDTGGLAVDKVVTLPALDMAAKQRLVAQNTFAGKAYETEMEDWLSAAYVSVDAYITGHRPMVPKVAEIDLDVCTEQAWVWEGRVAARDLEVSKMPPLLIVFQLGYKSQYLDWIYDSELLDLSEAEAHIEMVEKCSTEEDNPAERMMAFLVERQTP